MTLRNPNKKTERQGVRFVQGIVEDNYSIYHDFSGDDQGNDCYIEFVENGRAINYGIFIQIKSGDSYKDNTGYKITADKDHLNYWSKGLNLTIGIVYDPVIEKEFWVDITSYLNSNPNVLQQKYHTIRVDKSQEFSADTFVNFKSYCIKFREVLSSYEKYGRALEWFANIENPDISYEGLKALYSNHRDKPATWFYILSNFYNIDKEGIRRNILGLVSNYFNPDIYWHSGNIKYFPTHEMQNHLSILLTKHFGVDEVKLVIQYMEEGITRGSFSYQVFIILNMIDGVDDILRYITFNHDMPDNKRNFCFWLYMQIAKFHSIDETLKTANEYLHKFPFGKDDEAILGVKESIELGELWPVG